MRDTRLQVCRPLSETMLHGKCRMGPKCKPPARRAQRRKEKFTRIGHQPGVDWRVIPKPKAKARARTERVLRPLSSPLDACKVFHSEIKKRGVPSPRGGVAVEQQGTNCCDESSRSGCRRRRRCRHCRPQSWSSTSCHRSPSSCSGGAEQRHQRRRPQ